MAKAGTLFAGFPKEAFEFLAGLLRNNNKSWFEENRRVYEGAVLAPALLFVNSVGEVLRKLAPSVVAEPRIGGSLFRIHRDTRFSTDKRPYKTHVGIRLRDKDTAKSSKCTGPVFYVEFDARNLRLGVGVKEFDKETLQAYRQAVARDGGAREIAPMVRLAEDRGHDILGDTLARVPSAYSDHPGNYFLKKKGLFVREELSLPREIHGPEFVPYCGEWFKPYAPLFRGLRRIALEARV